MDIPDGWNRFTLGDLINHTKGYAFSSDDYCSSGVRIIRISDTTEFSIKEDNPIFFPKDKLPGLEKYLLSPKDIIINTVGSRPHLRASMVGKVIRIPEQNRDSLLNQNMVKIISKPIIDEEFLYRAISNDRFLDFVTRIVRGNANQVSITLKDLFSFQISLPLITEQKKIAGILSTWDRAIEVVERLIENSQAQKKALQQQLLTGKKRLPGFSGEWEVVPLTDVVRIETGSSNREDSTEVGEFTFFDRSTDVRRSDRFLFDTEAIIVGGEGQEFIPKYFIGKFDLHQRAYAIFDFENVCGKYIFYSIHYNRHLLRRFSVGSTVASLRMGTFQKLPIRSISKKEQTAIAAVLSDADREIELLSQQLSKLKSEKSALMQQLLTGKRRVKIDEKAAA